MTPSYTLRLVPLPAEGGVPVTLLRLDRKDGPATASVLHSLGLRLSPRTAAEVAAWLGALGVPVEREEGEVTASTPGEATSPPAPASPGGRRSPAS